MSQRAINQTSLDVDSASIRMHKIIIGVGDTRRSRSHHVKTERV